MLASHNKLERAVLAIHPILGIFHTSQSAVGVDEILLCQLTELSCTKLELLTAGDAVIIRDGCPLHPPQLGNVTRAKFCTLLLRHAIQHFCLILVQHPSFFPACLHRALALVDVQLHTHKFTRSGRVDLLAASCCPLSSGSPSSRGSTR